MEFLLNKKIKKIKMPSEKDLLKIEIAKEIGIWEQIEENGWESLSNATCGRVGGIMKQRLKMKREENNSIEKARN